MAARVFTWLSIGGGAWSIAANWDDVTDNVSPSAITPGVQDSVTVAGPAGATIETITGNGAVAAALFTGNTMLTGTVSANLLTVGTAASGGLLQLAAGAGLQANAATLAAGSVLVNGAAAAFAVAGTLALGSAQGGASATLDVTEGGYASVLGLVLGGLAADIYVDPVSILEVGGAGEGQAGALTVDAGALVSGAGDANAYGAVANNGTIAAAGGTLSVGSLSGTGQLRIGAAATLLLDAACGSGQSVVFAGANATLALAAEYDAPGGTLTGFAAGDSIDELGSLISSASYVATGAASGVLTLYYGAQVADRLTLAGSYAGSVFLTSGDGEGGTLIGVAPSSPGGGSPSPGTPSPDSFVWVGTGSGAWTNAANWQDQTTGADPAPIAPGVNNSVAITAPGTSFWVIAGPANAASLAIIGEVALSGAFGLGTLSVGQAAGSAGTLDLLAGTSIGASQAGIADGGISVAGSAAMLSVAGTLSLGGGVSGVGLPVTALTVTSGGKVRAGTLTIGGGSGDSITTDPSGSVEVGTLGTGAAGAVTIDPGASLTGNGSINPFGAVVDNGSISALGGVLVLGSVSGTGALSVGNGALELTYATPVPIGFTSATATLAFAGESSAPTGTLSGLVPGDVIDLLGSPLTSAQFNANSGGNGGTLALIYNGTTVGRLFLAGSFAADHFAIAPDGQGGTDIVLAPNAGGGGGGGQTGTDQLAWIAGTSGNWSQANNWNDVTTGKVATLPPGAQTPATVAGPSGTSFQTVAGTGTCASLAMTGNSILSGSFAIGTLSIGTDATQGAAAALGTLLVNAATTLSIGHATLRGGALIAEGSASVADISGTLTLGDGTAPAMLQASGDGAVQAGGLKLGGGSVGTDTLSAIEIGTLGGAAAGAITVDAGFEAAGYGTLAALGGLIDNGNVLASGGTLLVGAVSGLGGLDIGTESTLALAASASAKIVFAGAGATLVLPGTDDAPSAVIYDFAPGDSILTGESPVDGVVYQPGVSGVGTLTLSESGQVAGTLLVAGNYAGDSFAVQPDGLGAAIIVTVPTNNGGPPPGTVTPDQYVWTGLDGVLWSDTGNWSDTTQGQTPAVLAPGQNDSVTIAAASGAVQSVTGPGDAAALTLLGTVALSGAYGVGTLGIGSAAQAGVLALGGGASIAASSASVIGGIAGTGGALSVGGTLVLGQASGASGVVAATGNSLIFAGAASLQGSRSALAVSGSGQIEIGGGTSGDAGVLTIDSTGSLAGAGAVNLAGQTDDNGMLVASGGTLLVGGVSGTGTLLVGVASDLGLEGPVSAGLTVDFAGAGTLNLASGAAGMSAGIADFGPSDQIILPVSGATQAAYALTAPGIGLLTIYGGSAILAQLTLLGSQAGLAFSVAGAAGGGTILTATPANTGGEGGVTMSDNPTTTGGYEISSAQLQALEPPGSVAQIDLEKLNNEYRNEGIYEWYSVGDPTLVGAPFFNADEGVDIEVLGPGLTPAIAIPLTPGYSALIATGSEALGLTDGLATSIGGNALLVGNSGNDTIAAGGANDTLVGGIGANTIFFAALQPGTPIPAGPSVFIDGGGNDTITSDENAAITTSGGNSSKVFLGPTDNDVVSQGSDEIVCSTVSGVAQDTVTASEAAGLAGDTVFGPAHGELVFNGGSDPAIVVGGGGQVLMNGGGGARSVLWAGNSPAEFLGGTGSAIVVGGSQQLLVQGGTGPLTVFDGTGNAIIEGAAGPSTFVVGVGATTVAAASGNTVWIIGSAPVSVAGSAGVDAFGGLALGNNIFQAGAGSETLWGGAGNDSFIGGSGSATFVSGGGNDVFSFTNGLTGGSDEIVGFVPGADTVDLQGYGAAIPTVTVKNGSSYVTLGDGTHLFFYGITDLTAASFTTL